LAAGSPEKHEKQKINDDEGCDHATDAEGEHVANAVSGHALARLGSSFDRCDRGRRNMRAVPRRTKAAENGDLAWN